MNSETRFCQNCKTQFTIEPDDFQFYEKIQVPPPTFCPECRFQRRMVWRNERSLYKDTCDLCKKPMLSMYSSDKPFTVYCRECWWSDKWNPLSYGREYDWHKPFFRQYRELLEAVPRLALVHYHENVNVDYANLVSGTKNIYLSYSVVSCENVYYSHSIDRSRDVFDAFNVKDSEVIYGNVDSVRSYRSHFLVRSRDCIDSAFLFDCVNCQHCFMSSNVRNKQFVLRNRQYDKAGYEAAFKKENLGSHATIVRLQKEFQELSRSALHKYANLIKAVQCTGDNIENSKNVRDSFDIYGCENLRFCYRPVDNEKDSYDFLGAVRGGQLLYEGTFSGSNSYNVKFYVATDGTRDTLLSDWCHHSSNVFGCAAVRKKQYCILNKQYSKSEYESLVSKIIVHMDATPYVDERGRSYSFGEFFPIEIAPFAYNETMAQDYFPIAKEKAIAQGYSWRDPDPYPYKPTITVADLPDDIKNVQDPILKEIIACPDCGKAYRIIQPELQFLRQHNIALPRKCPECRHKERFALRNPLKLWHRRCDCKGQSAKSTPGNAYANTTTHFHGEQLCPNELETSYAPERPEIVYCEQCYNAEVV